MPLLLLLLSCTTLLHQVPFVTSISKKNQMQIIEKINNIRRGVEPTASNMLKMEWSDEAEESAKRWAEQCQQESSPAEMRTVGGVLCGEARVQSSHGVRWSEIIDLWLAKKSNFQYGVGAIDPTKDIFGYTQLIWYNTHQIGCAVAYCAEKEEDYPFFYVCRTCPVGNIEEMVTKPYKEGLPCEDCPHDCENNLCTNACHLPNKRMDCNALLSLFKCDHPLMKNNCKAACECTNSIV